MGEPGTTETLETLEAVDLGGIEKTEMAAASQEPLAWGRLLPMAPEGKPITLIASSVTIGRSGKAAQVLAHAPGIVSNVHARAFLQDDLAFFEDLSANGLFVNGVKVGKGARTLVSSGDTVAFAPPSYAVSRSFGPFTFVRIEQSNSTNTEGGLLTHYYLGRVLGSGTFATVRLAIHRSTGARVAVKCLSKGKEVVKIKGGESRSAHSHVSPLMQEANLLKGLRHPNIVSVVDVFETPETLYIVLEFAEGGDLYDRLVSGPLAEPAAKEVFRQLVSALSYLHDNHVAHRDLKPENILLVNKTGLTVKITDFGVARFVNEGSLMSSLVGTPQYIAPEVLIHKLKGKEAAAVGGFAAVSSSSSSGYDRSVDVWSLGVVLYVLLSSTLPFLEGGPLVGGRHGEFGFDDPVWASISDEAKDLIRKMLVVNVGQRASLDSIRCHSWLGVGGDGGKHAPPMPMSIALGRSHHHVSSFIQEPPPPPPSPSSPPPPCVTSTTTTTTTATTSTSRLSSETAGVGARAGVAGGAGTAEGARRRNGGVEAGTGGGIGGGAGAAVGVVVVGVDGEGGGKGGAYEGVQTAGAGAAGAGGRRGGVEARAEGVSGVAGAKTEEGASKRPSSDLSPVVTLEGVVPSSLDPFLSPPLSFSFSSHSSSVEALLLVASPTGQQQGLCPGTAPSEATTSSLPHAPPQSQRRKRSFKDHCSSRDDDGDDDDDDDDDGDDDGDRGASFDDGEEDEDGSGHVRSRPSKIPRLEPPLPPSGLPNRNSATLDVVVPKLVVWLTCRDLESLCCTSSKLRIAVEALRPQLIFGALSLLAEINVSVLGLRVLPDARSSARLLRSLERLVRLGREQLHVCKGVRQPSVPSLVLVPHEGCSTTPKSIGKPVPRSKQGGLPVVRVGRVFGWPVVEGVPLTFLFQISMKDLLTAAVLPIEANLSGFLYVFGYPDQGMWPLPVYHVIHEPDLESGGGWQEAAPPPSPSNSSSKAEHALSKQSLPLCPYDGSCFRRKLDHFEEFAHPRELSKPLCSMGPNCSLRDASHISCTTHMPAQVHERSQIQHSSLVAGKTIDDREEGGGGGEPEADLRLEVCLVPLTKRPASRPSHLLCCLGQGSAESPGAALCYEPDSALKLRWTPFQWK